MSSKPFLLANRVIYRILGAKGSARLARSWLGELFAKLIIRNPDAVEVFEGEDGIKLKLPKNEAKRFGLCYLGVINPFETAVVKKILSEGDNFMDIGAYQDGWYSFLAAKLIGESGHVYSFEPHPVSFQGLRENVELNNVTNITAEKLALSDKKGKAFFYDAGVLSSLFKSKLSSSQPLTVQTTTLDSYIQEKKIRRVRLIKIDTEGAEMKILRGAKDLLSSTAPDLIVEVVDDHLKVAGSNRNELLSYLERFGYKPFIFTSNGLKPYIDSKGQPTPNLFFTKRKWQD
jgi:FkbM family methyltransferase